jgi:hypothetical protein
MSNEIEKLLSEYPNYTREFYKSIYFEPKELFQGSVTENRIKTMPIIILGTSGSGKTTLAENIMNFINESYYFKGVCPVLTNEVSLGSLVEYGFQMFRWLGEKWRELPSIYVLAFDDATAVKPKPIEVRRFFSLRHVMREYTGVNEGAVYSIMLTHDWYSLDKIFRRYGLVLVTLSVPPLDTYSRRQLKNLLGEDVVTTLQEIFRKAYKEDKYKGVGFVKLPYVPEGMDTDVGYIKFSKAPVSYFKLRKWDKPIPDVERIKPEIYTSKKDMPMLYLDKQNGTLYIDQTKDELEKYTKEELKEIVKRHEKAKEGTRLRVQRYRKKGKEEEEKARELLDENNE